MAIALALKKIRKNENHWPDYVISVTLSGSYTTGGETVDLTTLTGIKARKAKVPDIGWVNSTFGYGMSFTPGTDMSNGKLKVFSAANTEIPASAYPANVSGDAYIVLELVVDSL